MDDDLDTPGALAGIFELVTAANSAADAGDEAEAAALAAHGGGVGGGARVSLRAESGEIDEAAARLVAERDEARGARGLRPGRRPARRVGRAGLDGRGHRVGTAIRR